MTGFFSNDSVVNFLNSASASKSPIFAILLFVNIRVARLGNFEPNPLARTDILLLFIKIVVRRGNRGKFSIFRMSLSEKSIASYWSLQVFS